MPRAAVSGSVVQDMPGLETARGSVSVTLWDADVELAKILFNKVRPAGPSRILGGKTAIHREIHSARSITGARCEMFWAERPRDRDGLGPSLHRREAIRLDRLGAAR